MAEVENVHLSPKQSSNRPLLFKTPNAFLTAVQPAATCLSLLDSGFSAVAQRWKLFELGKQEDRAPMIWFYPEVHMYPSHEKGPLQHC